MKGNSCGFVIALALGLPSSVAGAQFDLPQPSPQASVRNYELKGDLLVCEWRYTEVVPLLDQAIEPGAAAGGPEAWRMNARANRAEWAARAADSSAPLVPTSPPKSGA